MLLLCFQNKMNVLQIHIKPNNVFKHKTLYIPIQQMSSTKLSEIEESKLEEQRNRSVNI